MITRDTTTTDLRMSPPETVGGLGTAVRLADLFRGLTGVAPPVRLRTWDDSAVGPYDAARLNALVRPRRLLLQQMSRGDAAPGGGAFIQDRRMGVDQIPAVGAGGMDL